MMNHAQSNLSSSPVIRHRRKFSFVAANNLRAAEAMLTASLTAKASFGCFPLTQPEDREEVKIDPDDEPVISVSFEYSEPGSERLLVALNMSFPLNPDGLYAIPEDKDVCKSDIRAYPTPGNARIFKSHRRKSCLDHVPTPPPSPIASPEQNKWPKVEHTDESIAPPSMEIPGKYGVTLIRHEDAGHQIKTPSPGQHHEHSHKRSRNHAMTAFDFDSIFNCIQ